MAASVRPGERLRRASADPELRRLDSELLAELEVASAGPGLPFALVRRLHQALRDAGESRSARRTLTLRETGSETPALGQSLLNVMGLTLR